LIEAWSTYVGLVETFNTEADTWNEEMEERAAAVEERDANDEEVFPLDASECSEIIPCSYQPTYPTWEGLEWDSIFQRVTDGGTAFSQEDNKDDNEIGLPTTDGGVDSTSDRLTYLVVTSDSSETALSADVGHIYGRLGQGDLTVPDTHIAFAPVSPVQTPTAGMMVSVFPSENGSTGLTAETEFVNFEMAEVALFNGENAGDDTAFQTVTLSTLTDWDLDHRCQGSMVLATSVATATAAVVLASLY